MPITDFAAYRQMQSSPNYVLPLTKNMLSLTAGRMASLFLANPFGGTAPTTATALNNTSGGANPYYYNGGANPLRMVKAEFGYYLPATLLLADRLSHQGGLSGIVTTAQTTNLPTAALTRYTSGVGVWAGIQIYTAIGATATTFTVSYTNSSGVSGRTSIATTIGSSSFNVAGIVIPIPLQEGDRGVRSVESVTLLATTGTAGNFGVVLFKPLMWLTTSIYGGQAEVIDPLIAAGANLLEFIDNTCLDFMLISGSTGSAGAYQAQFSFAEDR